MGAENIKAIGVHKGEIMDYALERFGDELGDVRVIIHESDDTSELIDLGYLTSGTSLFQ